MIWKRLILGKMSFPAAGPPGQDPSGAFVITSEVNAGIEYVSRARTRGKNTGQEHNEQYGGMENLGRPHRR